MAPSETETQQVLDIQLARIKFEKAIDSVIRFREKVETPLRSNLKYYDPEMEELERYQYLKTMRKPIDHINPIFHHILEKSTGDLRYLQLYSTTVGFLKMNEVDLETLFKHNLIKTYPEEDGTDVNVTLLSYMVRDKVMFVWLDNERYSGERVGLADDDELLFLVGIYSESHEPEFKGIEALKVLPKGL